MFTRILLAVSDQQCARMALRTLENLTAHPDGELVVLGLVQPFCMVYAHKHPWIGRRVRGLRQAVMSDQTDEVQRLVRETSTNFHAIGWDVREEIHEAPIVEGVLCCCGTLCPQLLVVGSCLADVTGLWGPHAIWQEIASKAACPVLLVKHPQAEQSVMVHATPVLEQVNVARQQRLAGHAGEGNAEESWTTQSISGSASAPSCC